MDIVLFDLYRGIPMPERNQRPVKKLSTSPKPNHATPSKHPTTPSSSYVMGFSIEKGMLPSTIPAPIRPKSWEPLFLSLKPGDSFLVPRKQAKPLRDATYRYNKKLAPMQFVWIPLKGGEVRVGRIK